MQIVPQGNEDEILKRAKQKASDNGWYKNLNKTDTEIGRNISSDFAIIFSVSFGKAFWGEKEIELSKSDDGCRCGTFAWVYHQHRMLDEVQAGRSPIEYLAKFL